MTTKLVVLMGTFLLASISHMDAQIGKILDALEASGKMDNTYILFTSYHINLRLTNTYG